jgi:predicted small integral membrane protein
MARVTDLALGTLAEAIYADEEPSEGPAAGFKIFKTAGNDDSGLGAILYIKQAEVGLAAARLWSDWIARAVAACRPVGQAPHRPCARGAGRGGILLPRHRLVQDAEHQGPDAVRVTSSKEPALPLCRSAAAATLP